MKKKNKQTISGLDDCLKNLTMIASKLFGADATSVEYNISKTPKTLEDCEFSIYIRVDRYGKKVSMDDLKELGFNGVDIDTLMMYFTHEVEVGWWSHDPPYSMGYIWLTFRMSKNYLLDTEHQN